MAERLCVICSVTVKSKNYRCLNKLDRNVLGLISEQLQTTEGYACFQCANKVNRVSNLNSNIEKYRERLTLQKDKYIEFLQDNFSKNNISLPDVSDISLDLGVKPIPVTPQKCKKRALTKTPTPKKFIKRPLHSTPKHISKKEEKPEKTCKEQSTQTHVQRDYTKRFNVKVSSNEKGKIKSRNIQDKHYVSFLRQLVHGHDNRKLARAIYNGPLRDELRNLFIKELQTDCTNISRTTSSTSLREKEAADLASLNWTAIAEEWREASDILCPVIEAISGKSFQDYPARLVFPCSSLLYTRNCMLNKVQQAVGLVLDSGGATDETINLIHKLGMTVHTQTVWARKRQLISAHEAVLDDFKIFKHESERQKMVESVFPSLQSTKTVASSDYKHDNIDQVVVADILPHVETATALSGISPFELTPASFSNNSAYTVSGRSEMELSFSHCKPKLYGDNMICAHGASLWKSPNILTTIPIYSLPSSKTCSSVQLRVTAERDTAVASPDKTSHFLAQTTKNNTLQAPPIEIYGDNFDLMKNPSTMDQQRESWHWFLVLAAKRRVTSPNLANDSPKADIEQVSTSTWMPTPEDLSSYDDNLDFHIAKVLVQYVPFLKKYGNSIPEYIAHRHISETSQKSDITNCYLIDESENSLEGMIKILQQVNKDFVPAYNGKNCERVVFGGDVLTNERAFSAQEAMQNGESTSQQLQGFIHRPEGLHRVMNLVQNIYQLFYKEASRGEKGTLFQLRNEINRRDVSGSEAVTKSFRSHHKFVNDALDAYIVSAALVHFGMDSSDDAPSKNKPSPLLQHRSAETQYSWLQSTAKSIKLALISDEADVLPDLSDAMFALHNEHLQLETYKNDVDEKYHCPLCRKKFKRMGNFRSHMEKKHDWNLSRGNSELCHETSQSQNNSTSVTASFVRMALLARDTYDAYRMCDGDRVFRNAKLEFLYAFRTGHIKYCLWLWRMLAYEAAILSPRAAYEYKWNVSVNLNGGAGQNIPNDNCVELQVKRIKEQVMAQGANKSFASAEATTKTTQIVDEIGRQMSKAAKGTKGKKRPQRDKSKDILTMARVIMSENICNGVPFDSFANFKDPLQRIKGSDIYQWMKEQRHIAASCLG